MARKKPEPVRAVAIEKARRLVTVGPDPWPTAVSGVVAAIVRIQPPLSASDDEVLRLCEEARANGAARVFALPRPKPEIVPQKVQEAAPRAIGARAAVLELVEESASKDKPALRELCERIMARNGL